MAVKACTYITFSGNAKDAMTFYHEVFGGELNIMTYGDVQMEDMPFEPEPTAVAHADLSAPGVHVTGGDDIGTTPAVVRSDTYSIMLITDTVEEGRALMTKLSADGGEVVMPYEPAPWGDTYGQVRDRFDVLWQVDTGPQQG